MLLNGVSIGALASQIVGIAPTPPEPIEADYYMRDGGAGDGLTPETAGDFATVWSAASDGDVIAMVGDTTVPQAHTFNKSVTITAAKGAPDPDPLGTGHQLPNRFTRLYDLIFVPPNAPDVETNTYIALVGSGKKLTLRNMRLTFPHWPDEGEIWENIGLIGGRSPTGWLMPQDETASLDIRFVEGFHGYGPNQEVYDPTVKLPEFNSPAGPYWFKAMPGDATRTFGIITTVEAEKQTTSSEYFGWGDPVWSEYNTPFRGPYFIGGEWAELTILDSYFHDMREFSKIIVGENSVVNIGRNWFERMIGDYIRIQTNTTATKTAGSIRTYQNIMLDPIGVNKDNGDPHVDWDQYYSNRPESDQENATRLMGRVSENNFWGITRADVRAQAQGHFYQTSANHQTTIKAVLDYPKFRNCVAIGATYKGIQTEGTRDPYIRDSIFINPDWNIGAVTSQTADVVLAHKWEFATGNRVDFEETKAALLNSIAEAVSTNMAVRQEDVTVTGLKGATVAHSAIFADPSAPAGVIKPGVLYEKYRPIGAAAGRGPAYETLYEMLTDELDWTGEAPHIGPVDLLEQDPSESVTSNLFYLHGGNVGDSITCTLPAEVEMRQLALDRTSVVENWTNTPTCLVGRYAQLRTETPVTGNDVHEIEYGGEQFEWFVGTGVPDTPDEYLISTGGWFRDTANIASGTTRLRYTGQIRVPSLTLCTLFGLSGGFCNLELLNTGALRISVRDSASTLVISAVTIAPTGTVTAGVWGTYDIDVNHATQTATLIFNGTPYVANFSTAGTGSFPNNRALLFGSSSAAGANLPPTGTEYADLEIYRNGSLHKAISNTATTANADAWKQPASPTSDFTQGAA